MARSDVNFDMKLDAAAIRYFQNTAPNKLKEAREKSVKAMGMVWADQAKEITTQENHIDTGLYVNSIGYATGNPAQPLYDFSESSNKSELVIGANVSYAGTLEKRYTIFARALDVGQSRMKSVAETQIKNILGL